MLSSVQILPTLLPGLAKEGFAPTPQGFFLACAGVAGREGGHPAGFDSGHNCVWGLCADN